MTNWFELFESELETENYPFLKDIRSPKEDPNDVAASNFNSYKLIGPKTVPITTITDSMVGSKNDHDRVDRLIDLMTSPNGFFERIYVDQNGNVIEGQHRLNALRKLGVNNVPAFVIHDLSDNIPELDIIHAMKEAGDIHHDHLYQILNMISEIYFDEHGDIEEMELYSAPKGFEKFWEAAMNVLREKLLR